MLVPALNRAHLARDALDFFPAGDRLSDVISARLKSPSRRMPYMNKLIQCIEDIRARLDGLRQHCLKETPTRTILVDPVLKALGWDICDPNEVEQEYPMVDGKSVDYALKINGKPVLLVEAKALDDPLEDVKAITQVVGYAANDGILWCALTNGVKWQVYCSIEECPAPDKLMFDVSLDPQDSKSIPVRELAQRLWVLSRGQLAGGSLVALREHLFTDNKVRKFLDAITQDPPKQFVNFVRKNTGLGKRKPDEIRASIVRIWSRHPPVPPPVPPGPDPGDQRLLSGMPPQIIAVYRALENFCLGLRPGEVSKRVRKGYFAYSCSSRKTVFWGAVKREWVRLHLFRIPFDQVDHPPSFASPHSSKKYLVLRVSSMGQLKEAEGLIRLAFEPQA
jgi:hypothetical protein